MPELTALQKADILDLLLDCDKPGNPSRKEMCSVFARLLSYTSDKSEADWLSGTYEDLIEAGEKAWIEHGFRASKKKEEGSPASSSSSAETSDAATPISSS